MVGSRLLLYPLGMWRRARSLQRKICVTIKLMVSVSIERLYSGSQWYYTNYYTQVPVWVMYLQE